MSFRCTFAFVGQTDRSKGNLDNRHIMVDRMCAAAAYSEYVHIRLVNGSRTALALVSPAEQEFSHEHKDTHVAGQTDSHKQASVCVPP